MLGVLFLINVLLFSLAALSPVLLIDVMLVPSLVPAIAANGSAFGRFLRQVVNNELSVDLDIHLSQGEVSI